MAHGQLVLGKWAQHEGMEIREERILKRDLSVACLHTLFEKGQRIPRPLLRARHSVPAHCLQQSILVQDHGLWSQTT